MKPPEKIADLALDVSLAAAHTQKSQPQRTKASGVFALRFHFLFFSFLILRQEKFYRVSATKEPYQQPKNEGLCQFKVTRAKVG